MSISAISAGGSMFPIGGSNSMAQMKQNFDDLGAALKSGDLDAAKKAFAQLQKNAPAQVGNSNNPMSSAIDSLSKALASGDLKGAQDAYSKIQKIMSQGPPARMPAGGASGKAANSGGNSSASDNKVYDKKDANKDGTVSSMEEAEYDLKHPPEGTSGSTETSDKNQGKSGFQIYA